MRSSHPRIASFLLASFIPLAACDSGTGPGEEPDNLVGPDGGTLTQGALTLDVPPGALDEPAEITIAPITDAAGAAPADFLVLGGTAFDLQPDGLEFAEPATLTIRLADATVPAGVSLSELGLVRLDGAGATLPSEVDADQEVVTGTIEHFSSFAVGLQSRFNRVACPGMSLAAASGMPVDRVALGRMPDDFEPPLMVVATSAVDDTLRSWGVVELDAAGDATMRVPIHPSADPAGGDVVLHVSDGTRACAAADFTIAALPDAPGELSAVVDLLQEKVRLQAAVLGTTPQELIDTPVEDLPNSLIPMAVAQNVVDHPGNDHALRAIADGTSSESADARLDLLEPLLARTGLRSALGAAVARAQAAQAAGGADLAAPGTAGTITSELCSPEYVAANGAQFLDYCMDRAAEAAFEGVGDQILEDLQKGLTGLALVPALGTATSIGSAVIWLAQVEDKRNAALLPSLLTRMELEANPDEFLEDQEGPGSWSADVFATNQGYDLGQEFLNGALQATGVAGVADKAQIAGPEVGNLAGWVLTGPVPDGLLEGGTIEEFIIAAENYGPVPVDADEWSESSIMGDAFSKRSHEQYDPEQVGTATLQVETQEGEFGGQQAEAEVELRVKEIRMSVSPDDVSLSANEPQTFSFEVIDAEHPEPVEVADPGALQGTVGAVTYIGDRLHTVEYTAPSDPNPDQPDLLTLEYTGTTGARENATDRRLAIATIRFGRVTISPRSSCVEPGDVQTFTAEEAGLGDPTIRWEIESGNGSLSGTTGTSVDYIAPSSGSGTVTLRAYLEEHPAHEDRVTFRYGACTGLALFRMLTTSIGFPFGAGGSCANPDLAQMFDDDNLPEDALDPLVPPPPSTLLIDRTETGSHSFESAGSFGGVVDDVGNCVHEEFSARSGFDATFFGSAEADSVHVDIETYAESECHHMGAELGIQCSRAGAAVGAIIRFDLEIGEAADYRLGIDLTCDAYEPPHATPPLIAVIPIRVEPDGTTVGSNPTTQPISRVCSGGERVTLDHVLEFDAAAAAGQTDKVMIAIQFTNISPGALEGISEEPHDGYIRGFVTLDKQ